MKRFRGEGWALLGMIWALAWPTMLEQLMSTAVQYVDAAMVGRLGAQATAAVGATTTVSWLIGSTVSALGIGFLSFIAQAYGADDRARAARTSSQAVLAVLFSGTLFTVIPLLLSRRVPDVDARRARDPAGGVAVLCHPVYAHAGARGQHHIRHRAARHGRQQNAPCARAWR